MTTESPPPTPEQPDSAPASADAAPEGSDTATDGGRAFSLRALLIGGFLSLGLAIVVPWSDWVLGNTPLYNNYLPPIVTLVLVLAAVVVNPLLGKARLRRGELVVIAAMLLALGGTVSSGLTRYLPTTIAGSAKLLDAKANLQNLREDLDEETIAELAAKAKGQTDAEHAQLDTDSNGSLNETESRLGTSFVFADTDKSGGLSTDEWFAHRRTSDPSLVPTWRWPVNSGLYLASPKRDRFRPTIPNTN